MPANSSATESHWVCWRWCLAEWVTCRISFKKQIGSFLQNSDLKELIGKLHFRKPQQNIFSYCFGFSQGVCLRILTCCMYLCRQVVARPSSMNLMVAPVTGGDIGIRRAEIKQGIREVILCKDQDGKIGLRLKSIDNVSTFSTLVWLAVMWLSYNLKCKSLIGTTFNLLFHVRCYPVLKRQSWDLSISRDEFFSFFSPFSGIKFTSLRVL